MAEAATPLGREAGRLLFQYLGKIERCVAGLDPSQVWWRPNAACNSIGNLLVHLTGNLSQWVLSGLGGEPFTRRRSQEFAARDGEDGQVLLAALREVVQRCVAVAAGLSEAELASAREIQGYRLDGFGALLHAVEHAAYHTGQIVHITKEIVGEAGGIEFYPHLEGS